MASVAGSVITLKGVGGSSISASVPFAQNQVQAGTSAAASLFKCDIGAMAVADGTSAFKDSAGGAWPKGTFVSAYVSNATESGFAANNAWASVGQVDLQEAYNTGNTIQLSNTRNLIVSKPAAGTAGFQIEGNANSALKVSATSGAALNVGVYDAAGTTPQSQMAIADFRSAGVYDVNVSSEGQLNLTSAEGLTAVAKGASASALIQVKDAANTVKSSIQAGVDGMVTITANGNAIVLDAGVNQFVKLSSDLLAKYTAGSGDVASTGFGALPVANAISAATLVAIGGAGLDVASPTLPNVFGVTLAASSGSPASADIATAHGTLVRITKTGAVSVGQVVYLAANGQISATAPSSSGDTIMRVGYVFDKAADAAPVVMFAPQFIAKVL